MSADPSLTTPCIIEIVQKILKAALLIMALLILSALLAVRLLPSAVQALPGQVRGRLPAEILRAVTTPLPTALPAPNVAQVEINALINQLNPTPTLKATALPQGEPVEAARATPPGGHKGTPLPVPTTTPPGDHKGTPLPAPLAARHPPLATLTGLQIVPQKLNNCGPATLSINLNYYGRSTTQFDVAGVVKPHYDDRNVSPEELVAYTNQQTDLRAALYRSGDLDLAKRLIAAGFPVVIEKGYEPDEWQGWMGHYLTLYGYDDAAGQFQTIDTFLGPWDSSGLPVSYEEIEHGWQAFNYTFYVVYEADQEAVLREISGPILNDEQAMWQQALDRARAQIEQEPNNAFAWFNLGSSMTHLGQITADSQLFQTAASAFDQALLIGLPPRMLWYQFEPYEAYLAAGRSDEVLALTRSILENQGGRDVEETYLYRGQALLAQGDSAGAQADYARALELRPGFPAALEALAGLENE